MMGYSVTEAASVLGVPTERVWELLARGVLSGEPEGETGMRVFLQPRPAPAPVAPADDPVTARSNGPEREMSPFRELLTEFRSLTERYGQALLALGESRGEVASLRSRVDMLEARIDLRLPMGPPSAAPWPTQSLPVSEPAGASGARPEAAVEHDDEDAHRRRRRGARRATESFAQALARAEDPSLADLSRGSDADALAAFRSEAEAAAAVEADRILPREVLPAEPMLVAEEREAVADEAEPVPEVPEVVEELAEPVGTPAAVVDVEREPIHAEPERAQPGAIEREELVAEGGDADALIATLPAAEPEPWPEFEAMTATPDEDAPDQAALEPGPDAVEAVETEPGALAPVEPEPDALAPVEPEPDAPGFAEPQAETEPQAAAGPVDFDAERYTTVIEQPDWFEAEVDDVWPAQTAAGDETSADVKEAAASTTDALPAEQPEPAQLPTGDLVPGEDAASDEPAEPSSGDEPDWSAPEPDESGADEMELAGSGGQAPSARPEPETGLPGSRELDEALGAFGPVAGRAPGDLPLPPDDDEWPPASVGDAEPPRRPSGQGSGGSVGQVPGSPYPPPLGSGSATRAYRRLRRIFPT